MKPGQQQHTEPKALVEFWAIYRMSTNNLNYKLMEDTLHVSQNSKCAFAHNSINKTPDLLTKP